MVYVASLLSFGAAYEKTVTSQLMQDDGDLEQLIAREHSLSRYQTAYFCQEDLSPLIIVEHCLSSVFSNILKRSFDG